jgi:thiamine biosynthesis protein ThiI
LANDKGIIVSNIIIGRYGEIHLKGDNRGFFLRALKTNIVERIAGRAKVAVDSSRVLLSEYNAAEEETLLQDLSSTFGIVSVSPATVVQSTPQAILDFVKTIEIDCTFKAEVNRADKNFPHPSPKFAAMVGGAVLESNPKAVVDVINPKTVVNIDIRDNGHAYVFFRRIAGVGGMPVGTAGRSLVMLSGGIDSPVAAFYAAKRGLAIDCIHFASPPYTSSFALEKVKNLARRLEYYCGKINLHVVPFTDIQEQIRARCKEEYTITLMRRFMVRIAEQLGISNGNNCIITGENLSQVASQTVAGMASNNGCATVLPILRPLVMFDKSEIVECATKIGTYKTSIQPHADCCTVFVPRHPSIRPNLERVIRDEQNLDIDGLVQSALKNTHIEKL